MPLLISKIFVIYKDYIKLRLKKAKLKIYFIINCWIVLNKIVY